MAQFMLGHSHGGEAPRRPPPLCVPPERASAAPGSTASGGSLTYVTPDEYIRRHVHPRPARARSSHRRRSREVSFSSESPELYFQSGRKYTHRSYGGLCLSMSIVAVIVAVIGIVSVAAYLGVATKEDKQALQYEMQYAGQFRVLHGDVYHPELEDARSDDFRHKAARYQRMLETLYGASSVSEAFRHVDVHSFDGRPLTVFFRIHLDRRKIPRSVVDTEEALRDVLTQEVMALQPKAFRALQLDINSIHISREKNLPGLSPVLTSDVSSTSGQPSRDSAESSAASPGHRAPGGVATSGSGSDVHQLQDWVRPPRVGSVMLQGQGPTGVLAETESGAEPSPALHGRPITEYQPSEYGDFPPALVGRRSDLATAASVESHLWGTGGVSQLPARPPRPRPPHGDSAGAGVVPSAGGDRARPAAGAGSRPAPPEIVPFVDRPSVQLPEYDRTPWRPVLPSGDESSPGQRVAAVGPSLPLAPGLGETQGGESSPPSQTGQGSVWDEEAETYPEEHRRGPDQFPVKHDFSAPASPMDPVQPRPDAIESNPETDLPAPYWPKFSSASYRPPPRPSRPPAIPSVASFLPSPDKLGAGLLQMLSEFVLARTKPTVLSRTEPNEQLVTGQSQAVTEQSQPVTEQPEPETELPDPETEQLEPEQLEPEPERQGPSDTSDQMDTEEPATLPPLTVVLKPAPAKSKKTSADKTSAGTLSGASVKTVAEQSSTTQLTEKDGSSAVPDIIITFSAVNGTPSHIKRLSEQPAAYLPDKLVRKTLTIVSKNDTEDNPYVTHPSGIISKSPFGSSDLLDPMSPTTASPIEKEHHADFHEVSSIVSPPSDPFGQAGLTEDGDFVTTPDVVSFQTVPPHLHFHTGPGGVPAAWPTPPGTAEGAVPAPVGPSPLGTTWPAEAEGDSAAVTVSPEQAWERDGHVTRPFFRPVTSYSGVYPPSRPKPPSLPHPEYPAVGDESNPPSSYYDTNEEGEEDYFYYDTEIFTGNDPVHSIFDMFSTRKPLVLDTDIVTSTSVRERSLAEGRAASGLSEGAAQRRGPGRRKYSGRVRKDGKESTLKKGDGESVPVLNGEAVNEVNVTSANLRHKRSLAWLRLNYPREDRPDISEPSSQPRSRLYAIRRLPSPTQTPVSSQRPHHPAEPADADLSSASGPVAARRVRRPLHSSQSVASLAARLRLAASPTERPRRGSRHRLPPRREKLADKLMRFRGVRSRGIFATTARPERRWRLEGTTRLPNSAPIQVIKYDEGATVDDILDRIFETRREFESSKENEVGSSDEAAKAVTESSSSELWKNPEADRTEWQGSEKMELWSPVKENVQWTGEEHSAIDQVNRMGLLEETDLKAPSEMTVGHHSEDKTGDSGSKGDRPAHSEPTVRPPVRLITRPSRPSRPTARPGRPSSRPTYRPTHPSTTAPTTVRPTQKWRPVRFRLPTDSDWPRVTEPPRLADKLSRLTTTPEPPLEVVGVSARPAPAAASTQLVVETDNEVGTAAHPSAVVPTRPTLASLLSNYTYPEEELTPPGAGCPGDQFRCVSGECIPRLSRCDLLRDCADGSDEMVCTCADRLNAQFLERKICDGIIDCHDSTDEQFCDWCQPGQFICPGAKRCVPAEAVCDGEYDCPDGADEHQCVTLATSRATADQRRYQSAGYLMVRRRGQWGPLCVDDFDALVRRTGTDWSVQELGKAVCNALTYNETTGVFRTDSAPSARRRSRRQRKRRDDPFYRLVLSEDAPRNTSDSTSLVFEEATCPRQTAVHISCDSLKCGLRPRVKQRRARIVGGTNSSPGAWPWQAAMYRDGEYQCGATLISDRWLLSAGHCYLRSATNHWVARLGAYRRGSTLLSPFESLHQVSHIIVHPDYEDVGYVNDIALLRLADSVSMSDFVRPVCLPPRRAEVTEGAICSVIGWGQLFESGRIFPDTLQEVELPLITSQQCKKRTSRLPLYKITDDMFCAGYDRGGRDACLGDSGGPLMCQEPSGEWTLTGITSNGYGCARALRPGVYTKVANYVDWIERITTGPLPRARRTRCRGHRCPLGRCLKRDSVCDGVVDCADGSDERQCSSAA
ncbi:uncharacterized protein LOC122372436 [Amphibalanus amphitrite]|uniref:uncharacterized protein LOC122372436 n=1 Tax=Amphibalanus amphitrite TaxID=1232801 RepID=UPI001C8FB4F6|nr:uncharacterized protein LOC122372436 [Amphibalanus amphitrite]